jgi:hypothetical protein
MKKWIFSSLFVFYFVQVTFAQFQGQTVYNRVPIGQLLAGGLPFTVEPNEKIEGTPFLYDFFSDCYLQLKDKKFYSSVKVRFNLVTNKLHFQNEKGQEIVAEDGNVLKFHFSVPINDKEAESYTFGCGYPESPGTTAFTYFQEYNSGAAGFLRLVNKFVAERKTIATVDPVKAYEEKDTYYVYNSVTGKLIKWRKGKDFILDMLSDKATEVNKYIADNKLACKNPEDIIQIIQHYNTITK